MIVKEWMGHRDLATTLRYSHTSALHEQAAMEGFGTKHGTRKPPAPRDRTEKARRKTGLVSRNLLWQ